MSLFDLRDIKGPVSLTLNLWWLLIMVLLVSAIAIGWYLYKRFHRGPEQACEEIVEKTPYEIAREWLDRIRGSRLIEENRMKEYFSQLSDCVRYYIEGRFTIKAPEMTTEEFLRFVKGSDKLMREQKDILKDFLTRADMVKFAKYGPSKQEVEASFAAAEKFVEDANAKK